MKNSVILVALVLAGCNSDTRYREASGAMPGVDTPVGPIPGPGVAADATAVHVASISSNRSRKPRSYRAVMQRAGSSRHATAASFAAPRTAISPKPATPGCLRR